MKKILGYGYKGPRGKGVCPMKDRLGPGPGGMGFRARQGTGPGGTCVCPKCGYTLPHGAGVPCIETTCPNCGKSTMLKAKMSIKSRLIRAGHSDLAAEFISARNE